MDRIFRDVLAKADIRNAIEGTGISITGTPNEVATLSASAEVQALIDASLLTATDESGSLDNVRQLVAGDGSIVLTDVGAGAQLEISVGAIGLGQIQEIPTASILGNADPHGSFGDIAAIWTETDDQILRKQSTGLDWGYLWAAVWPDSMCTALSGASFALTVTAMSLIGSLTVFDALGTDGITLSHDGTSSIVGNTNSSNLRVQFSGGDRCVIADAAQALSIYGGPTADHVYLAWYADAAAQTTRSAYMGFASAGTTTLTLDNELGNDVYLENNVSIRAGNAFRVYDATNVDYVDLNHDGTDLNFTLSGTVDVNFTGVTGNYTFDSGLVIGSFNDDHLELQTSVSTYGWKIDTTAAGNIPLRFYKKALSVYTLVGSWSNDTGLLSLLFGLSVTGQTTISAAGSHLKLFETDALDPADFALFEVNGEQLNFYYYDNSAATYILPFQIRPNAGGTPSVRVYDALTTDYLDLSHDGTDGNILGVNTADLNIYGMDFVKLEAHTYVTGGHNLRVADSSGADYVEIAHSGTNAFVTMVGASGLLFDGSNVYVDGGFNLYLRDAGYVDYVYMGHTGSNGFIAGGGVGPGDLQISAFGAMDFTDGMALKIRDSSGVDYVQIAHDGTDVNVTFATTTDINFSNGIHLKVLDSGGTNYLQILTNTIDSQISSTQNIWLMAASGHSVYVYRSGEAQDLRIFDGTAADYLSLKHDGTDALLTVSGTTYIGLENAVRLGANSTTPTHRVNTATATTASSGTASAPSGSGAPAGYWIVLMNGSSKRIPYFDP